MTDTEANKLARELSGGITELEPAIARALKRVALKAELESIINYGYGRQGPIARARAIRVELAELEKEKGK